MAEEKACSNTHPCSCPETYCARHGKCCDCVAYHLQRKDIPMCFRMRKK